jgi:hypothetical protein
MPAKTKSQFRLMKAAENNPAFAKKVGIKPSVAKEFTEMNVGKRAYSKLPTKMAEGGKVNEAGNYTKPEMRRRLFDSIKGSAVQGTAAGQWSARKAQLLAKKYKERGGGYRD